MLAVMLPWYRSTTIIMCDIFIKFVHNALSDDLDCPIKEDLTPESIKKVLSDLQAGRRPKPGPQSGRRTVEPAGEAITLVGKVNGPFSPAHPEKGKQADLWVQAAGTEVFLKEWQ